MTREPFDLVVVGGGIAGLAAACRAAEVGKRVCLLERGPVLGGRARSERDAGGDGEADNGQHLLAGAYAATRRFLRMVGSEARVSFQPRLAVEFRSDTGSFRLAAGGLPGAAGLAAGILRFGGLPIAERLRAAAFGARLAAGLVPHADETALGFLRRAGQGSGAIRRLWTPLVLAALNEDPARASAALLREVLVRAFFAGGGADALGWARAPLSEVFAGPARAFLLARRADVRCRSTVRSLAVQDGRVVRAHLESGDAVGGAAFVVAVPPKAAAALLSSTGIRPGFVPEPGSPILSVLLRYDRAVFEGSLPFVALWDSPIQWVFDRAALWDDASRRGADLALVVSEARVHLRSDRGALATLATSEMARFFPAGRSARLLAASVRKEPEATFFASPSVQASRPGPCTALPNLFLAGDWTATGLPCTIESACLSAEAVTGHGSEGIEAARARAL